MDMEQETFRMEDTMDILSTDTMMVETAATRTTEEESEEENLRATMDSQETNDLFIY